MRYSAVFLLTLCYKPVPVNLNKYLPSVPVTVVHSGIVLQTTKVCVLISAVATTVGAHLCSGSWEWIRMSRRVFHRNISALYGHPECYQTLTNQTKSMVWPYVGSPLIFLNEWNFFEPTLIRILIWEFYRMRISYFVVIPMYLWFIWVWTYSTRHGTVIVFLLHM